MKKTFFAALAASFFALTANAQLVVNSDGQVALGSEHFNSGATVSVGLSSDVTSSGSSCGIASTNQATSGSYSAGVMGSASLTGSSGSAAGVAGSASGGSNVTPVGVFGSIPNTSKKGAAVCGAVTSAGIPSMLGNFAGYFLGNVYITGTATIPTIVTPSDVRLKENVVPMNEYEEGGATLDNVLRMNVVRYNYKNRAGELVTDTVDAAYIQECEQAASLNHYGLLAQELQELYPDLVMEGDDGYLGVNYQELVPILIRSIQELKEELDALKGSGTVTRSPSATTVSSAESSNANVLYQNTPNPFKDTTKIRFQLADNVANASVCIFDLSGKLLKRIPVSSGMDSVSVNGFELGEGMFLYSLVVNGQEIDTKRMILSK